MQTLLKLKKKNKKEKSGYDNWDGIPRNILFTDINKQKSAVTIFQKRNKLSFFLSAQQQALELRWKATTLFYYRCVTFHENREDRTRMGGNMR